VIRRVIFIREKGLVYRIGEKIFSLDEVVLLKHIILKFEGFINRKNPSFGQYIRDIVSGEMREFIKGE
jgi:hypothetical protein